ncbi:MAG: DNA primase, partial [Castellaniella sp.]
MPLSRFMLDELASRHDLEEAEGRAACVHEARPLFAQMPEGGFRLQLEREFARRVRLTPDELARLLVAAGPAAGNPGQHAGTGRPAGQGGAAGGMGAPARFFRPEEGHGPESGEAPWLDGEYPGSAPDPEGAPPWLNDAPPRAPRGPGRTPRRGGGARQVTPMARRLLRLLLAHPVLVSGLGDQQLELLAHHPHLELVRQLIGLASTRGAAHAGALLQAADPESDLARAIQDLSTELMAQDLPDPQAEWDDALRLIERQTVQEQCDRLIES